MCIRYQDWKNKDGFKHFTNQLMNTKSKKTIMDNKFKRINKGNTKGYWSEGIVYFCDYHKIKCFGYGWKMQQFITNKTELSNFNKNLPAFVFI